MRTITCFLLSTAVIVTASCGSGPAGVTIHVSSSGSDDGAGSASHPFATLARAIEAARAADPAAGRTILLHKGAWEETAVVLTAADSGLVIAAAPGEQPVLYGGRRVTGWVRDGDFVAADLPGSATGEWNFRALVVDGHLAPRARLPKEGAFRHNNVFNVRWMSSTAGGWERKPTDEELTTMIYHPGDLGLWLDVRNAELTIYHAWDESMVGLKALNPSTRTITFSIPAGHPPGAFGNWMDKANTYVVWNVREGMSEPGQWYLDRTNGRVVYWPLPGRDIGQSEVIAPSATSVIVIKDGRDIVIRGITVAATTTPLITGGFGAGSFPAAIEVRKGSGCRFEDVVVENAGGWAYRLDGNDLTVSGGECRQLGAGGVRSNGTRITVEDCRIHHIGEIYPSAIGILGGGEKLMVLHNEFHHTPYSALHISADSALIEGNLFHETMQVLNDGAAIYVGFADSIVVRGNIVRGSRGAGPAHAYYIDEHGRGCIVERNLAVDTAWPSHNHMTIDCVIRDNLFIDTGNQRLTFPRTMGMRFERNVCIADTIEFEYPTGTRVTEADTAKMPESIREFARADGITAIPNNILFSRKNAVLFRELAEYRNLNAVPLIARDGTLFADPLLVDEGNGRYSFAEGSQARKLGIEPLDVSGAGPRR